MDIRELFTDGGTLTPRFVLWLVEWLPDTSALAASQSGGKQHRPWTVDRHINVSILETLRSANYQRGGNKGSEPKPVPRPKPGKQARRTVTVAQLNEG